MDKIGRYNAAIYRNVQSIINFKLRDLDIKSGQQDFFYVISKNEGISQKELSDFLYVSKSTTAKAVKNLVKNNYVKRLNDENDKRAYKLYLTDKGKEIIPKIESTFLELTDIFTKDLSEIEKDQIHIALQKILTGIYEEKNTINSDME